MCYVNSNFWLKKKTTTKIEYTIGIRFIIYTIRSIVIISNEKHWFVVPPTDLVNAIGTSYNIVMYFVFVKFLFGIIFLVCYYFDGLCPFKCSENRLEPLGTKRFRTNSKLVRSNRRFRRYYPSRSSRAHPIARGCSP